MTANLNSTLPTLLADLNTTYMAAWVAAMNDLPLYCEKVISRTSTPTVAFTRAGLAQLPTMKNWLGEREIKALAAHSYACQTALKESSFAIDRDEVESGAGGMYINVFKEWAGAVKSWIDIEFVNVLTSAASKTFDGEDLFSSTHSSMGGSQDNDFALALNETNLTAVIAAQQKFHGADLRPLGIQPKVLMVGPALRGTAEKLIYAPLVSTGGTNVINKWGIEVVTNPFITSDTAWYVFGSTNTGAVQAVDVATFRNETLRMPNIEDPSVLYKNEFHYLADCRASVDAIFWPGVVRGNV
jgi:phage major head subunit gpT-like protein